MVFKETVSRQDWISTSFLFLSTAAVVVWQNSRVGIIWDASYILENAYRISLGQLPYRDFPFPFAPLTFLIQAGIIKLAGRVFSHHVLYCAVMGGLASVLTWRILRNLLEGVVPQARQLAFSLSLPLLVLGIYCIFPHPFYDPDCTFSILLCLFLLQQLEKKGWPIGFAFLTGMVLAIPSLVKQNAGLAFLGSTVLAVVILMLSNKGQQQRGYIGLLAGATASLTLAFLLIQITVGADNYLHWTFQFAAARRLPPLSDLLSVYWDERLPLWLAVFAVGVAAAWVNRSGKWWRDLLSLVFLLAPLLLVLFSLYAPEDPSDPENNLLALWPFWLLVSGGVALGGIWKGWRYLDFSLVLPFILIATIQGAFLSQLVWGSTYGIWPLLLLLIATTLANAIRLWPGRLDRLALPFAVGLTAILMCSGGHYLWTNERLDYIKIPQEKVTHSTLQALTGLSVRGHWLADFDELVLFARDKIPKQDGLMAIPGEDLFYYATGRKPLFPVLMFDHTINPYSPDEILQLVRTLKVRWLVVKRDLQLTDEPVENRAQLLQLLNREFIPTAELKNYTVYRRNSSA